MKKNPHQIKTIVHLLSGGLDSVTMLYDLVEQGHSVHALLFNYNQRHQQELMYAKHHCDRLGVIYKTKTLEDLGGLTKKENWIVALRNGVFILHAANYAARIGADTITIGCNSADQANFPDCRKEFLDNANRLIESAGYEIEVCAPYLDKSKAWIARLASDFKIKRDSIWTCYQPTPHGACGKCPACKKLNAAMK